jgi:hypothetical protein
MVVAAVLLSLILLATFLATRQTDLAESTPAASTRPPATPTQPATAPSGDTGEIELPRGSLPALLRLAPDWIDDADRGLPIQATYADLQHWVAATGLDPATPEPDAMPDAIAPLSLPEALKTHGFSAEWREVYGFDLRQVDQVLAVGQAPNLVLIMPGHYDADTLYATWVASGYQAVEVEETTVWSLVPGDRIDLSAPASRPALGLMNHVVLLEDGTLVTAARQSLMAEALRVVSGDASSLFDRDGLREASMSPENISSPSAVIASGQLLRMPQTAGTDLSPGASPITGQAPLALPAVDLVVLALASPAQDDGTPVVMTLVYDDAPNEIELVCAVMEERARGDPVWSRRHSLESIVVAGEDGNIIEARFSMVSGRAGLDMIDQADLIPFAWYEND